MMADEKAVKLTARLYECRDAARALFGAKYEANIAGYRDLVRAAMAKHQMEALPAARHLIAVVGLSGVAIIVALAAALDVIEGG